MHSVKYRVTPPEENSDDARKGRNGIPKTPRTPKFNKRTCVNFVPTSKDPARCCCGRREDEHRQEATQCGLDTKWNANTHTKLEPTNAVGELEFTGASHTSRAKYVRIADNTRPQEVIRLMFNKWKLNKPKLLISVTGGAKDFVLHPQLKQMLKRGLLKAAQSTSAWIITGGTNTGVMRHVGEAVAGHAVMSRGTQFKDKSNLHLIGIATWGIVNHKEVLENNDGIATYHMTSSMASQGACLDNNHSNFILVDDGTVGKYGGEIKFRARLEKAISEQKINIAEKSRSVPVVLLVLEGGPNTIKTVVESVTSNPAVPVVIAEGSGRAADILAHAHHVIIENKGIAMEHVPEVVEHGQILLRIQNTFPGLSEEKYAEMYQDIITCVYKQKYITIFKVDEDGLDIDKAILKALLKAQHTKPAEQLSLALIWNRADIAKAVIFTEEQRWEKGDLDNAMMDALLNNRVEFVKFLLEHGVNVTSFLTEGRLADLYRKKAKDSFYLKRIIGDCKTGDDRGILWRVERAVGRMLSGKYKVQTPGQNTIARALHLTNVGMSPPGSHPLMMGVNSVRFPFNELLVWAVLCNMQSAALFMWESGDENLAKALVAATLYKSAAKKIQHDDVPGHVLSEMNAHAREFQKIALDLLNECAQTNATLSHLLLTYNLKHWANQTCMSLAVALEHEEFLAHACCQTLLRDIWTRAIKMEHGRSLKVITGILFPPSIFFFDFKNREELSSLPVTLEDHERDQESDEERSDDSEDPTDLSPISVLDRNGSEASFASAKLHSIHRDSYQAAGGIPDKRRNRLAEFYSAPITKFWVNVIAYLAFLGLFSYVILVKQDSIPDIPEIVLIVFVFTLLTEEIRQILHSEPTRFKYKLKAWASSNWNLLDGLAMLLFFIGMGLRMSESTVRVGHVIYCFDLSLWIIRLLDIFSISKYMGPYVVMIGRMAVDMAYFLIIMVIFMLAYGIAQQAILHPQQEASVTLLSQIFFRPYFQIYGELFLEDPEQTGNETTIFGTEVHDSFGGTLVTLLTAWYLLVANILLLNLLIAIFNNTYSQVQANSLQIWKYQRYFLVMEYAQRPILPPPFIILNHVAMLVKGIYRRLHCCKRNQSQDLFSDHRLKKFLGNEDLHNLILFEEQCLDTYLTNKNSRLNVSCEERVRSIEERTETISTQLQELSKEKDRLAKIEEQHKHVLQLLKRSQLPTSASERTPEDFLPRDRSQSKSVIKAAKLLRELSHTDKPTVSRGQHAGSNSKARLSPYPNSKQQRSIVPDHQVEWKVACPGYSPPNYTSEIVMARPLWADPDISGDFQEEVTINFNCLDNEHKIDRRSHVGLYDVIDGLPRWKRGPDGEEITRSDKGVLEFVCIQRRDSKEWALPGGMVEPGDSVSKTLRKEFCEEALSSLDASQEKRLQMATIMNKFFRHGIVVYKGYVDDPRNTDNAWMETVAMNFHDYTGEILGNISLKAGDDACGVQWQEVSGQTPLYANHASIIRRVAELHGAFF